MEQQLPEILNWITHRVGDNVTNGSNVETILFYIMATLAIPCAIGVIFDRAIIRSGFLLIGMFGAVSGLFLLLQAQFLAMAQIMIYAVGITLVVVIALMLTNPRMDEELSPGINKHSIWSFAFSLLTFFTIYMAIRSETWPCKGLVEPAANNILVIGRAITTDYALPFEFASVLLLAALIGSIMLAKAEPAVESLEYSEGSQDNSAEPAEALTTSR
jgi:NAD(P)H-quinone oxidoreductase subunit 6